MTSVWHNKSQCECDHCRLDPIIGFDRKDVEYYKDSGLAAMIQKLKEADMICGFVDC